MKVTRKAFEFFAYQEFTSEKHYGTLYNPKRMSSKRFKSMFHLSPSVCKPLWKRLDEGHTEMPFTQIPHLLYALYYMKNYCSWSDLAGRSGKDEKTVRKWAWIVIRFIAEQDWVSPNVNSQTVQYVRMEICCSHNSSYTDPMGEQT